MIRAVARSRDETQALAAVLAEAMQPRDIVMLIGEIGSGKTTFTQGFGLGLGVQEPITSPTFVLMRSYQAKLPLHHIDIYRLDHLQEVIDLGIMELLDEGGVALIEWGDHAAQILPRDFLEIRLLADGVDENMRHIRLRGVGTGWSVREKALKDSVSEWCVDDEEEEVEE